MLCAIYFIMPRARWFPGPPFSLFLFTIVFLSIFMAFFVWFHGIERRPMPVIRLAEYKTTPWTCEGTEFVWKDRPPPVSDRVYVCTWPCLESSCRCYDPAKVKLETGPNPTWAIDDASELRPNDDSIFFFETTCQRGRAVNISFREACGVESAARLHPHRTVYLLVVKQSAIPANVSYWSAAARTLLAYPNVRFARVSMPRYVRGTPLGPLFDSGALSRSRWPSVHAGDFLRFLTLWRFGGVTLDLDFVVTKPLGGLGNFVAAVDSEKIASGAMGLTCDDLGRYVSAGCVKELHETFHCYKWGFNGAGVVTRVLSRLCATSLPLGMTVRTCGGFHVLPAETFFPVGSDDAQELFSEDYPHPIMRALNMSFATHMWFTKSQEEVVSLHSQQPYAQVARQFCPRVVAAAGKTF